MYNCQYCLRIFVAFIIWGIEEETAIMEVIPDVRACAFSFGLSGRWRWWNDRDCCVLSSLQSNGICIYNTETCLHLTTQQETHFYVMVLPRPQQQVQNTMGRCLRITQSINRSFNYSIYSSITMDSVIQPSEIEFSQKPPSRQSCIDYKPRKVLPHINEEYEFRITNRILIEKIMNPRRDKTIMDSLAKTACSNFYKKKTANPNSQSQSNFRRKVITSSSVKKNLHPEANNDGLKDKIGNNLPKSKRCSQKMMQGHYEDKQKEIQQGIINKVDEPPTRNLLQTQPTHLRDNFVGKIVRNSSSRQMLSKRKNHMSNICDNLSFSASIFLDNQVIEKQAKWNSNTPFKRIIRQDKYSHFHRDSSRKQNIEEYIQQEI